MKAKLMILLLVMISLHTIAQEKLLGTINRGDLEKNSFEKWFVSGYDSYKVHKSLMKEIKNDIKEYEIKVFLGTWCGDSKREVPHFLKIVDQAKFPKSQLQLICLDKNKEAYKQSPTKEEKGLNIHRVPTFVFYKDGKEVNRIVEKPISSLERDIVKIVKEEKYNANYTVVSILEQQFSKHSIEELRVIEQQMLFLVTEYSKGSKELNTYGYVKLRAGDIEKALYIFELNNKAYPLNKNTFDSLGEAYFETNQYNKAKECYEQVLAMNPNDKEAIKMLVKVNDKL